MKRLECANSKVLVLTEFEYTLVLIEHILGISKRDCGREIDGWSVTK